VWGDELPATAAVVRWPLVILVRDLKGVSNVHSGFGDFNDRNSFDGGVGSSPDV
jgi:hypothetical protein